jgi:hypothetical protein
MAVKRYNGTDWDTVAGAGTPGAAGIVTSATAPSNTAVLWADTTVTTNNALIPAGGTTGQVLSKTSSSDYAASWSTPAGGGKVLQVVTATTSGTNSTSTSTFADTGLSASITPSASTSRILVMVSQGHYFNKNGAQAATGLRIMRDATSIWTMGTYGWYNISVGAANTDGRNFGSVIYLDSPSSTSAITYKTQGCTFNTTSVTWQESGPSMITLMEIGA